jgi:uncharacterized protein
MAYALITGASSGIGYEMAKIFAENGIDVVLVARSENKLKNLSEMLMEKHHIKTKVLSIDLSQPHAAKHIYDDVNGEGIEVDYLVNNAGFGDYGKFAESDWEKEQTMINLNINAVTHLTRLFLPDMVKRNRGRILNLGSTGSFQPCPLMAVYCASKAYILSFTEALANELKGTKVTVTALCPGATRSGFQDKAEMEGSNLIKGKLASPNEVALFGYKAMMKGKTIAVHGFKNRLLAGSVRFFPRKLVTNLARKMMER